MTILTAAEKESVNAKVNELMCKTFIECERNQDHSWLNGLYHDIIMETAKHGRGTIIFDYAKLLEEENQLYSAEEAYFLAQDLLELSVDDVLKKYLLIVSQKTNESGITMKQQTLFHEICLLLGEMRDLLTDFTATYRKVNGVVKNNIEMFIEHGKEDLILQRV